MSAANIKDIVANKRGYKYPYIKVNQISPAMSTTIRNLQAGDMMLVLCKDGKEKAMPDEMSMDIRNINKLLKTTGSLTFYPVEGESIPIVTIKDYMEALDIWI